MHRDDNNDAIRADLGPENLVIVDGDVIGE